MSKTVFITGASSGIGYACAERFAQNGYRLILNARRKDRIEKLAADLEKTYGVESFPLVFDVRDREQVFEKVASLPAPWQEIDVLVNNAGLALGMSEIQDGDPDDWDQMIDTNVKGLLYVTKAVVPLMKARRQGHIFNIGSIAAKETYPRGNVYCGTKHAVDSLTKGMRIDLLPFGIKVSLINPGATHTEFSDVRFKGDKEKSEKVYDGYQPLSGDDIAQCIYFCAALPEHVNVNDMLIMPAAQATATLFDKKA